MVGMLVAWQVMADLEDESRPENNVLRNQFDFLVLHSRKPVLVFFHADWCDSCDRVAPMFESLATGLDGKATVHKVNIDNEQSLAKEYKVQSVPALLIFDKGKLVERLQTSDAQIVRERLLSYAS